MFDHFYESGPQCFDFLISTHKNSNLQFLKNKYKFIEIQLSFCTLYIRGLDINEYNVGDILFSGVAKFNKRLISGPTILKEDILISDVGNFFSIKYNPDCLILRSDFFGLQPLYYGNSFVSNRLHLIYLCLKELKCDIISESTFYSNFLVFNAFCSQLSTFDTILKNIKKLKFNSSIIVQKQISEINNSRIIIKENHINYSEILDPNDYWKLIEDASNEIVDNIECILNTTNIIQCSLTAGRDSRVCYSALVSMGKINDVQLNTLNIGNDRYIATGLVSKFGGSYKNISKQHVLCVFSDIEQNFENFMSYYFFTNFSIYQKIREIQFSYREKFIEIGGTCGEIYRDFYSKIWPLDGYTKDKNSLQKLFLNSYWAPEGFESAFNAIYKTFQELDGDNLSSKLSHHYLNFRNVYHFGCSFNNYNKILFHSLLSKNLYLASVGLPENIRRTGRVLFDITKTFCEEIAYSQYENTNIDYSTIPYHRKCRYDGSILDIEPNLKLITDVENEKNMIFQNIYKIQRNLNEYKCKLIDSYTKQLQDTSFSKFIDIGRINYVKKRQNTWLDHYLVLLHQMMFIYENKLK